MRLFTRNGYDFFVVSSMMQKALRRGDPVLASVACNELLPKFSNYVWNRLLIVSAEDCASELVTQEVVALWQAWEKIKPTVNDRKPLKGRVFFIKAIVLLAKCRHSRDSDEMLLLVANRIPAEEFERAMGEVGEVFDVDEKDFQIPDWVYDVHTREGKRRGKNRDDFLKEEHYALTDRDSIFTNFDEMADSWGWAEPQVEL